MSKGHRVGFEEALAIIRLHAFQLPHMTVPLDQALGGIVAADVKAQADHPLFDMSAMDGYAFAAESTRNASRDHPVRLTVDGTSFAGHLPDGTAGGV